ncbi:RNA polymerase sigma factor [Spirosoma utsteinense]|uniref:RNA polymerase sigma-70 factor (ECF subfamily) n=1 Tax=Spirosoma utsteinense TaxID=2585773 RepID=A0ABR6W726_9BACT|nr:sigma-70 family RNA polymerase sigma factor [Spirosoma utsteinense]MBC3785368.1 RNA polymerase sigma-70 factor (ECF subfamily) [Spirosoma utsteinense]MBC3791605.1 RNA polymerase sigma-70 factor (ECF subfamily) [Spirosoma utsteinense]
MANTPNIPPLSDLLAGCLRNHRQSQELLYRQFYGYAMSVCLRYAPTREGALEVLNDGFLKVFTRLEQYDPAMPFKSWLRRILINTALDHYRQEVRHHYFDDVEQVGQTIMSESADAHSQLAHEELLALIQRLSPAYRLVFNLYVMDGFTHDEIAAQLGISVGASKSNLARAREKLRSYLKHVNYDEYARPNR